MKSEGQIKRIIKSKIDHHKNMAEYFESKLTKNKTTNGLFMKEIFAAQEVVNQLEWVLEQIEG